MESIFKLLLVIWSYLWSKDFLISCLGGLSGAFLYWVFFG